MKWIALTGGIATGKSTVSGLIQSRGYTVIDADQLAREVVQPGEVAYLKLVQDFGPGILQPDKSLDRKKLAEIIFNDEAQRLKVEQIIHPQIQIRVEKMKEVARHKGDLLCFYDVPLLFEKSLRSNFDSVVVVYASEETQKKRMKARNSWSDEEIQKRLQTQIPIETKRKNADFVLMNEADLPALNKQVEFLIESLLKKQD